MHAPRPSIRLAAAAGLAVTALAGCLSACGSTTSTTSATAGSSPVSPPASPSYSPGQSVTTAQVEDLMKTAMSSTTSAHVHMTMTVPTTGSIVAQGVVAMKPAAAEDLTMKMMGRTMEVRLLGKAIYVHTSGLPDGIQWMKLDLSALSSLGVSGLSSSITNPMSMLDKVSSSIEGATYVGREKLGGVEVDHYRLVVDAKKAVASMMPSGVPTSVPSTKIPKTATEDVFVGPDGRVAEASVDEGTLGKFNFQMSDYNQKVSVVAPPKAQTKDLSDMVSQMGSSGGL